MTTAKSKNRARGATRRASKRRQVAMRLPQIELPFSVPWRGLLGMAFFLVLGYSVVQVWSQVNASIDGPVDEVQVRGNYQYLDVANIQQLISEQIVDGYLGVNLQELKEVLEQQAWVEVASVRRKWPSTLEIWLQEQRPAAYWGEDSYITDTGEVFTPDHVLIIPGLPHLYGKPSDAAKTWAQFLRHRELLTPLGLQIAEYRVDDKGALRMRFENTIELVLGSSDVEEKLSRFAAIYQTELAPRAEAVKRVDARYTNGLAVSWHETVKNVAQR